MVVSIIGLFFCYDVEIYTTFDMIIYE